MAIDLEKNYHDLGKWFMSQDSYHDWEGFASGEEVKAQVDKALGDTYRVYDDVESKEKMALLYDLVLHAAYERTDTYELPNEQTIRDWYEAFLSLLGSRWWMRHDAV